MLPSVPPQLSGKDFDPSNIPAEDDVDMENQDDEEEGGSSVELSSVEINILVYLYLLESNFAHTAFTLLSESSLPSTSLFQHFHPSFPSPSSSSAPGSKSNGANAAGGKGATPTTPTFGSVGGKIPRGELVRKLWKGIRWEEVERHVNKNGETYKPPCPAPFHLLIPHICPSTYPSSAQNPPLPLPAGMKITSPPRRSEAFPPARSGDDNADAEAAGPSRPRSSHREDRSGDKSEKEKLTVVNGAKGKRRSRRNSTESNSRADSPAPKDTGRREKEKVREGDKEREREKKDEKVSEKVEKKRGRPSAEAIAMRDRREKDKEREKEKPSKDKNGWMDVDDSNTTAPKVKIRNSTGGANSQAQSREESPAVERKRKRIDDGPNPTPGPGPGRPKSSTSTSLSTSTPSARNGTNPKSSSSRESKNRQIRGTNNPLWISDDAVAVFTGHRDSVTCLGWNPRNLDLLASGSLDGMARLWELSASASGSATAALVQKDESLIVKHTSIESSKKTVRALAWHPEGSVLATAAMDGVGRLFTPAGQLQGIMSYGRGCLNAIKFSPDGRSVLTAKNDFVVSLWTVGKGYAQMLNRSYDAHTKEVNDVDWLDDNVFATAGNDHTIFIFHTSDKHIRYTLKGHTDDVTRVKWSPVLNTNAPPESRLLASVSDDGFVLVWKLPGYPAERGRIGSRSASPVKSASASGSVAQPGTPSVGHGQLPPASGDGEDYFEGQGRKGKEGIEYCVARLCVVDSENKRLNKLEWSPACTEGRMLLAAGAEDSTVKIFNISTGQLLHSLSGLESGTASLTFSPLGIPGYPLGAIAAGGWNGQLGIWDVDSGEKRGEWEVDSEGEEDKVGPVVYCLAWRNDAKQLALGLQNKLVVTVGTDLEGMTMKAKGKKVEKA